MSDDPIGLTYKRYAIRDLMLQGYKLSYAKGTTKVRFTDDMPWQQIPFTDRDDFATVFDSLENVERGSLAEDAYLRWKHYYPSVHNATVDFGKNAGFGQFGFNSAPYGEIKYSEVGFYDVSNYQIHAANGNLVLIRPNNGRLEAAEIIWELPVPTKRRRRRVNVAPYQSRKRRRK